MSSATIDNTQDPKDTLGSSLISIFRAPQTTRIKVFISSVNSYHGSAISKALKEQTSPEDLPVNLEEVDGATETGSELKDEKARGLSYTEDAAEKDEDQTDSEDEPPEPQMSNEEVADEKPPQVEYFITGTCSSQRALKISSFADEIVSFSSFKSFEEVLLDQDFIIYDLNFDKCQLDEAFQAFKVLEKSLLKQESTKVRHFILISNPMTWARTEQNSEKFSDQHYRKRRPHPCYRSHLRLEQEVTNLQTKYPGLIRTIILCPGVTIGYEEDVLHYFFKMALFNKDDIELFEPGDQTIPLLHVDDLASMICQILKEFPPENVRYLLGLQSDIGFHELMMATSTAISGPDVRLKICPKQQIFLLDKDLISQRIYDKLNLNLKFDLEYFSSFQFSQGNLEDLNRTLVEQYYNAREIRPIKVIIHGPPTSGKTTLARALACYYGLHYISPEHLLEETKIRLERRIKRGEDYVGSQQAYEAYQGNSLFEEMLAKTEKNVEAWRQELLRLDRVLEMKDAKQVERLTERYLKERLTSNACSKNQGYVIDSMTLNIEAVKRIFLQPVPVADEVDLAEDDGQESDEKLVETHEQKSVKIAEVKGSSEQLEEAKTRKDSKSGKKDDKRKSSIKAGRQSRASSDSKSSKAARSSKTRASASKGSSEDVESSSKIPGSSEEVLDGFEDLEVEEVNLNFGEVPYSIKSELKPDLIVFLKFNDPILYQQERCLCYKYKDRFSISDGDCSCSECSFFLGSSSSDEDETFNSSEVEGACSSAPKESPCCGSQHPIVELKSSSSCCGKVSCKQMDVCTCNQELPPCSCSASSCACTVPSPAPSKLEELVLPNAIKDAVRLHEHKRLDEFRETEYEDASFYTLVLDCGLLPLEIVVNKQMSAQKVYNMVKQKLGPRNEYMVTDERRSEEKRMREQLKAREAARKEVELKKELEKKRKARERQLEAELAKKMELKRKELRDIEACSVPLREYLMEHIVPHLAPGLVELAHVRPENPIDYLAEYLFKNNPKCHLFDPSLSDRQINQIIQQRVEEAFPDDEDDPCEDLHYRIVSSELLSSTGFSCSSKQRSLASEKSNVCN